MSNRRKLGLTTAMAVACSVLFGGCDDANDPLGLGKKHSKAKSEADLNDGTIVYSSPDFDIVRITIKGQNYLANSKGGLIREEGRSENGRTNEPIAVEVK